MIKNRKEIAGSDQKAEFRHCEHRKGNTRIRVREYGHITYLILAIEKITAKRNGYVNELSYVSPDY